MVGQAGTSRAGLVRYEASIPGRAVARAMRTAKKKSILGSFVGAMGCSSRSCSLVEKWTVRG